MRNLQPLSISVQPNMSQGIPGFEGELSQVTVLLGANGTGKSKLLFQFKGEFDSKKVVYVEGGRVVRPPILKLNRNNFTQYGSLVQTRKVYESQSLATLGVRIESTFMLLKQSGVRIKSSHSDAVMAWINSGEVGPCPKIGSEPLEELFELFHDLFPQIRLSYIPNQERISCIKKGNQYNPDSLSDGERQCLGLLADIAIASKNDTTIVVDEPELNLHPMLAASLWNLIEKERPDARFIYATHSISFALRQAVETVFILTGEGTTVGPYKHLSLWPKGEIRPFLGTIPAILSAKNALAVEGEDDSFDSIFYHWITENEDLRVVPLGNCESVLSASKHTGIWEELAPEVKIAGVIDRDFRSDNDLSSDSVCTLKLHEAESYLCLPNVVVALAEEIGTIDPLPTPEEVEQIIRTSFEDQVLAVAARRTFHRAGIRLGVSISKEMLAKADTEAGLKEVVCNAASVELGKATNALTPEAVELILTEEIDRCKKALNSDILEILKLMPGKELLNRLAPRMGCKSDVNAARGARKHLKVNDFPELLCLRQDIQNRLGLTVSTTTELESKEQGI